VIDRKAWAVALTSVAFIAALGWAYLAFGSSAQAQQLVGLTPAVSDASVGLQVKALPGSVYSVHATNETSTAGLLIGYNSITIPGTGALTAALVRECYVIPASGTVQVDHVGGLPTNYNIGITYLIGSGTSCATYTTGTVTGYLSVKYQ
jgi:hypothetical protein